MTMTETEREILREREETLFGERKPYESNRQATYEDTVPDDAAYEDDDIS